jgi:hypothetical protein
MAPALEPEEAQIHEAIKESNRKTIVRDKKALLLKAMLTDAGIQDSALSHQLMSGIPLVGEAIVSSEFPEKRREASLTVTQVMKAAKWTRTAAMSRSGSSGDIVLDKAVWENPKKKSQRLG